MSFRRRNLLVLFHLDVVARNESLLGIELGPVPVHVVLHVQDLQGEWPLPSLRRRTSAAFVLRGTRHLGVAPFAQTYTSGALSLTLGKTADHINWPVLRLN